MPPIEVRSPDGKPLIEITFIEDKIYELNKKGESALTPEKDRIRMRVRKVSGEVVKIDDSELGWEQSKDMDLTNFTKLKTLTYPTANPVVESTVYFQMGHIKIVYTLRASIATCFVVDVGEEKQDEGNCAIAYNAKRGAPERLIPSGCLQTNIFLWKPNNYPCYTVPRNVKKHEDENIWFCKYCATPKKRGYQLECPRHVGSGYDYSIENQSPKPKNPEPVLKKI